MTAQHTPGPWEWRGDEGGWFLVPGVLAICNTDGTPGDDVIDRANARLIAAAPDLLAALEGLFLLLDAGSLYEPQAYAARAAIAKAKGGSQ
jgi:hypothetical protein